MSNEDQGAHPALLKEWRQDSLRCLYIFNSLRYFCGILAKISLDAILGFELSCFRLIASLPISFKRILSKIKTCLK